MRILQVSPYSWDVPGGVQVHVDQLATHLRSRGHEVHVLAPARSQIRREGVTVVGKAIPFRGNGSVARICFSPQSARIVKRALLAFRPDVIHVHEPLAPSTAMFTVLGANAPVVATFHSNLPPDSAGGVFFRLASPVIRPVWNRIDRFIAVSPVARASVLAGMGDAPVTIVPNGLDVDRFANAPRAALGPGRHMLFVGRLEPRKGFPVAVRAFALLARGYPDLRLLVVGDGSARNAIDNLPADVIDRVVMLGRVKGGELPAYYRAADVFVSPALGNESFGIVLLEAMAAGLPVVASDISGYRDVARNDREALLVPPADPDALAAGVARVLEERELAESLVEAGRRRARDFSWEVVATRLEEIYRDVVMRSPARRRNGRGGLRVAVGD
jgi:phosphatidylinositol alpha-mannosyltransferase